MNEVSNQFTNYGKEENDEKPVMRANMICIPHLIIDNKDVPAKATWLFADIVNQIVIEKRPLVVQSEIRERLKMSQPTLKKMLDLLEDAGLWKQNKAGNGYLTIKLNQWEGQYEMINPAVLDDFYGAGKNASQYFRQFVFILQFFNANLGYAYPCHENISKRGRIRLGNIKTNNEWLEKHGFIKVVREFDEDKYQFTANKYVILRR